MTPEDRIRRADDTFFEIFREFRLFHYINPINHLEERERFMEHWEVSRPYQPEFEYNLLPSTIGRWKKKLEGIDLGDTDFEKAYLATALELHRLLELAEARGTQEITMSSMRIYGEVPSELAEESRQILKKVGIKKEEKTPDVGVKGLQERLRERLRADRIEGWDVVEDPTCVGFAEVDGTHHKIRLQSGILVHENVIDRLAHHLVEGHVFRAMNAERQPYKVFAVGLAGWLETEEGLALELEQRLGLLVPSQLKSYAGRVVAAAMTPSKSFFDIVSELVKFFPVEAAYSLAERSKRGLARTAEPGGYVQDHIFLQGKKKIGKLSDQDLNMLFVGKISADHLPLVKSLIAEEKILDAAFVPDAFHG